MPTGIEDIVKNAQLANYNELMFEDDLENLSLSFDDSSDSFRFQMASTNDSYLNSPDQQRGDGSKNIKSTIKSAKEFIESDAFATITKDKVTVDGEREKLNIMCSTPEHHAVLSSKDKSLIRGHVCSMGLILMASKDIPFSDVFDKALRDIVRGRRNIPSKRGGVGPEVHVCLAWLCHAAQCSVSDLVPKGEIFPEAERYIHERLEQRELPTVPETDRTELAIFQICRVLDMLSVFDLRSQSPVDRSILIYAICRLILDKSSCCTMQYRASIAIENILNASSLTRRATLVELTSIFPLISDDVKNLQLCLEVIRQSNAGPSCCLSLFSSLLIHLSERAECEPSALDNISDEEFDDANLGVIVDVLDDVLDIYENDEKKKCVILVMLDISLQPLLHGISRKRRKQITDLLQRLKCEMSIDAGPNGALNYRILRNLMDRFEIQSTSETRDLVVD